MRSSHSLLCGLTRSPLSDSLWRVGLPSQRGLATLIRPLGHNGSWTDVAVLQSPWHSLPQTRSSSQVTAAQSSIVLDVADLVAITKQPRRPLSFDEGPNFTKAQAVILVEKLSHEERKLFLKELKKVDPGSSGEVCQPSWGELKQLAYHNSLPFIGFGFLDNFIMIVAGEYIDFTLGATLGISTMAAAALGNTLSDMCGIGSAWYVESWSHRLGAHPPDLSPQQLELPRCRVSGNLGRALGVVLGCLIGMFPLLFIDTKDRKEDSSTEPAEK